MQRNSKTVNREIGFSLLELLVSLAVMLVLTAAAFVLLSGSIRVANSAYYMTDAEESMRAAHEIINRDLTSAGDGLKNIGNMTTPLGFAGTYLTRTTLTDVSDPNHHQLGLLTSDDAIPANTAVPQAAPAANFLPNSDRISLISQDKNFNGGNPISVLAGKITVVGSETRIDVGAANIGLFQVGEIYAVVAASSAAFGLITSINAATNTLTMSDGDTLGLNQTGPLAPISRVSGVTGGVSTQNGAIIRLQIIQYYVTSTGMLMRRTFGVRGGAFEETAVAEHVTNLQFRFQTNISGANGFITQPITSITSTVQQSSLREVETTIAVETVRAVNKVTNSNANDSTNGKQTIQTTTATTVRNLQFGANAREQ
jgi:prepilin-type N-terminal cleavage/methylation domain-containing protein